MIDALEIFLVPNFSCGHIIQRELVLVLINMGRSIRVIKH